MERGMDDVNYPSDLIISHRREDGEADASFGIPGCNWELVVAQIVALAPIAHLMQWPVVYRETYSMSGEVLDKLVARQTIVQLYWIEVPGMSLVGFGPRRQGQGESGQLFLVSRCDPLPPDMELANPNQLRTTERRRYVIHIILEPWCNDIVANLRKIQG